MQLLPVTSYQAILTTLKLDTVTKGDPILAAETSTEKR